LASTPRNQEGFSLVISFSVPEARNQLLNEGTVYTYRWTRRKQIGKTWANSGRDTKKIADVFIEEMGQMEANEETLESYASDSGFHNVAEWVGVIIDLGWQWAKQEGWLYKVTRISQQLRKTSVLRGESVEPHDNGEADTQPVPASSGREKEEKT